MKQIFIFIGGMLAGALLLYAIGYRSESAAREKIKQELFEKLSGNLSTLNQEAEVQYVDVIGKKGRVTLHTGMSKDSVQLLVGKSDKVDLNTYGNYSMEIWGYLIKNKHISDLNMEFKDGKLKSVRQD